MSKIDITTLDDQAKLKLVENRWKSGEQEIWEVVKTTYERNVSIYSNKADWLQAIPVPRRKYTIQANRIFVNMEAVINSLIANPPGINVLPARDGAIARDFASKLESFFRKKYLDLNIKEVMRMGYRNLYFGRIIIIKAFWNPAINDFDFRTVDPRKFRVGKYARKEQDSEYSAEEIDDNLCAVIERFPKQKDALMKKYGYTNDDVGYARLYTENPNVTYKEFWTNDYVIFKLDTIVLDTIQNPYWDWDGILITQQEEDQLTGDNAVEGEARRNILQTAKLEQDARKQEMLPVAPVEGAAPQASEENSQEVTTEANAPTEPKYKPYFFNYFDNPRKPYIFATIFNNENSPVGRTDMITLSAELQKGIDKRKMDIDENCELVNGIVKIDASVMGKSDAQRIRWETKGIIWGKNVVAGVSRETGQGLPPMVFEDMQDSRNEIDNIMAATSAFRGEREGQETKAGRLALIQQSFLRLNELVQLGDYVAKEIFDWGMQMAKTRYTEYHYAKWLGKEGAREVIELIQDDFETGSEVKIIAGKTLPVDDEFRFEQAQNDFKMGALGLTDYLEAAKYDDAKEKAQNAVKYKINPPVATGIPPEDMKTLQPPQTEDKPPNISINYADLPPDAQVQLLAKIGIQADPAILTAEKIAENLKSHKEGVMKDAAQVHSQTMAEKTLAAKTAMPPGTPQ